MIGKALQDAVEVLPAHDQFHGPAPEIAALKVPDEHKPAAVAVVASAKEPPFAPPHNPLTEMGADAQVAPVCTTKPLFAIKLGMQRNVAFPVYPEV